MIYTKHVSTRWWPSEVAIRQGFRAKTVNKRWLRKPPWTVKQPQTHKTGTFAEQNHIWVISWHNLASKHATSQREREICWDLCYLVVSSIKLYQFGSVMVSCHGWPYGRSRGFYQQALGWRSWATHKAGESLEFPKKIHQIFWGAFLGPDRIL